MCHLYMSRGTAPNEVIWSFHVVRRALVGPRAPKTYHIKHCNSFGDLHNVEVRAVCKQSKPTGTPDRIECRQVRPDVRNQLHKDIIRHTIHFRTSFLQEGGVKTNVATRGVVTKSQLLSTRTRLRALSDISSSVLNFAVFLCCTT